MRKQDFCLCENKGADQLISAFVFATRTVQNLSPSSIYVQNFKLLACFCVCTGWFVSDMVGNPEACFSQVGAHIILRLNTKMVIFLENESNK